MITVKTLSALRKSRIIVVSTDAQRRVRKMILGTGLKEKRARAASTSPIKGSTTPKTDFKSVKKWVYTRDHLKRAAKLEYASLTKAFESRVNKGKISHSLRAELDEAMCANDSFLNSRNRSGLCRKFIPIITDAIEGHDIRMVTILHRPWTLGPDLKGLASMRKSIQIKAAKVLGKHFNAILAIELAVPTNIRTEKAECPVVLHLQGVIWPKKGRVKRKAIQQARKGFAGGLFSDKGLHQQRVHDVDGMLLYMFKPQMHAYEYSPDLEAGNVWSRPRNLGRGIALTLATALVDATVRDFVFGVGDGKKILRDCFKRLDRQR